MLNQHITDYLQYYVDSKKNPDHAVMLNGPWGSGKTWFIKEFVKDFTPTYQEVMKFFHVSLYGTKSIEDIDGELFRQAHPFLSSRSMIIGKAVAKGFMKGFLKIDLDGDGKEDFKIEPNDLKGAVTADDLEEIKPVLIFDDLERCPIDIIELLGYINHFVEIQGYKVIILAHEDALKKRWEKAKDGKTSHRYEEIKEKLVGKTFTVEPNVSAAISSFVDDIEHEKSKVICKKNIEAIEIIFNESTYNNLRHIKRGIWDYSLFVNTISDNATIMANDDFLSDMLNLFLIYTIEARKGIMKTMHDITNPLIQVMMEKYRDEKPSEVSTALKKYSIVNAENALIRSEIWDFLLFSKNAVSISTVEESILSTFYFYNESTPAWKRLWRYYDLEDSEFRELKKIVEIQFSECDFECPQILLHVFGIFLQLNKENLIKLDKQELVSRANMNVDILLQRGLLYTKDVLSNEYLAFKLDRGWDGLGYHCVESELFINVWNYIKAQLLVGKQSFLEEKSKYLSVLMAKDPNAFLQLIVHTNYGENHFFDKPVLQYICPVEFARCFANLSNAGKMSIHSAISLRYEAFRVDALVEEAEWLENVRREIEKESIKYQNEVSSIHFATMNNYIDNSLRDLKEAKEKAASLTTPHT
ncbi:P-loop NTPase fold protein [Desulfovibrio gilichinskyi]|uniref:KAP family P-loop domain-containing protein n=1 Tax=Desulfovibrio gilichinskyi TaxID=1519643 RepID=A0A1X7EKZ6_9BACT|nr:P-loop NTPase fold protein [Desulfovibrio gilichinskyi]SMF35619.1 KAP family P-loop domain-containing protein [Desulfovibrio gilichinskyi]